MKIRFIFIALFAIYSTSGISSNNQTNKLDDSELKKILRKASFASGYIIQRKDTIPANILLYRRRHLSYSYLYCIVKSQNDSILIYTPQEITGYSINKKSFISHTSKGKNIFIKLREEGRVSLYSRGGVKNDIRVLFYLKFPLQNEYLVISPYDKNIDMEGSLDSRNNPMMIVRTNDIDLKFKRFVELYFKDCTKIVNMVNSGFYTINDIPSIVKTYNSCFDK